MPKQSKGLTACYMDLLAAIYESGRKCGDEAFLKSDWGEFIKDTVYDYAQSRLNNPNYSTGYVQRGQRGGDE